MNLEIKYTGTATLVSKTQTGEKTVMFRNSIGKTGLLHVEK